MRRKKGKHYFTKETEDAIVSYCATEDISQRSTLYIEHIQPAFDELVDKIVFTYKFNNLENIDYLKDDCKIWLTTLIRIREQKPFHIFQWLPRTGLPTRLKNRRKKTKEK